IVRINATVAGMQLGLDGQRRIEKKKSFQTHMNWRTATAPKAGNAMGRTILKNTLKSEAPSTRAASSTSFGRAEKKVRMNRTIHGSPTPNGESPRRATCSRSRG